MTLAVGTPLSPTNLGSLASQDSGNVSITGGSLTGVIITSANATITGGTITGITDLAVADGGTGASTASGARNNLGCGNMATQSKTSVDIDGGDIQGTDIRLVNFNVAGAPSGVDSGDIGYCTDGNAGQPAPCYYDGTDWRVISTGAVIST